jgi:hypothetical protein
VRPSDARPTNRHSTLRLGELRFVRGERPKEMAPKTPIQMCEHVCPLLQSRVSAVFPGGRRAQTLARLRTYWLGERNLLSFQQALYVRAAIA